MKRTPASPRERPDRTPLILLVVAAAVVLGVVVAIRSMREQVTGSPEAIVETQFVGAATCASCHAAEHEAWQTSQHERAMALATTDRVLGDFDNVTFTDRTGETTFFRQGETFIVRTAGADGKVRDFPIRYTFGVDPIQQYLIEMPDGRVQALSIAWDSRPADEGGQRWFHLYGDDPPPPGDELHWTGRLQNWNFMCADCHSTNLRKNYDASTDRFATTWTDINVGCEACHGPGSKHVSWANASAVERMLGWQDNGLTVRLDERDGVSWSIDPATGRPSRSEPRTTEREILACAPCHSRRTQLAEGYRAGLAFTDFYRPVTLDAGLFHADGQQLDEVYTYASFAQSRMAHAGVTCSDCHDPHTARVRAPDNTLCAQCHVPARYDTPDHHRHTATSTGPACVACHMPERTYMLIDPRRDHSIRVPRPDLSVELGVPNACTACHTGQTDQWAAEQVEGWLGRPATGFQTFARAFHADVVGAPDASAQLIALATDTGQPAIVQASALARLAARPSPQAIEAASKGLANPDAEVRLAALQIADALPPRDRLAMAGAALVDGSRAVRIEAARLLAGAGGGVRNADGTDVSLRARAELEASLQLNADRPEARNMAASLLASAGRVDDAIAAYRAAIAFAPDYVATYVNLADLYGRQGREVEAETVLRQGLTAAGERPELLHALGLSLVRAGRRAEAVAALGRAAVLAPDVPRFGYAWAVALHSTGEPQRAIAVLEDVLSRHPRERDGLYALATFLRDAGRRVEALRTAERLAALFPEDAQATALVVSLR
jgi:tetratricopeptide (TPR) repeat protein